MDDGSREDMATELRSEVRRNAVATHYALDNPFTSQEEKLEIESWYQLPIEIASHTLLITSVLWAYSYTSGWIAYGSAALAGVLVATLLWSLYARSWVVPLFIVVRLPVVGWMLHLGIAAWLAVEGHWGPAILIATNRLLLGIPAGVLASFTNQLLSRRYGMHPKYAFLKHFYGKSYPFEQIAHPAVNA